MSPRLTTDPTSFLTGVVRKPLSRSLRVAMRNRSVLNRRLFEGLMMSIKTIDLTPTFTVEHT
jgi:hypothetical protein